MERNERYEALQNGDTLYFTGKACKHGHVAKRRASNGCCVDCEAAKRNTEERKKYHQAYVDRNRETVRKTASRYIENNRGKVNARTAARHATKMQRQPKWLTKQEKLHMRCLYQVSAMRNRESDIKWHVDHIVPMQGENVCGLHVPWNLRVIPAEDNIRKSNRFEP